MPLIYQGNWRGLADSKYSGVAESFAVSVGIDGNSTPGILKIHQALAKDSGSTVTALCRVRLAVSSGETFWFSYTDGKIWRRSTAGTWLLVYTTTPAAGGAGCLGADEFDGFIYWATESRLHRIAIGSIATAQNWTDNASEDWATFTNTDSEFHPMVQQNLQLFIGDANFVAKVTGDTGAHSFTADALDLRQPLRVKTLIDFDIDILIGTFIDDNVNKTEVLRWDTESTSWQVSDTIEENGINAFIRDDNFVYVQAGQFGRTYLFDGQKNLIPFKRIPGDWSPTQNAEVYPQAVSTLLTIPVFGLSNITGNPALQGVYSLGSYSKDYPKVMDLSFPISNSATLQSLQIGAVLAVGADLLVSWQDGANFGVDALDYSNKYGSAFLETMVQTPAEARNILKAVTEAYANYVTLPASTDITFSYKKAHEDSYTTITESITDSKKLQKRAELVIDEVAAFQLKIAFTVNSNDAPQIESFGFTDNVTKE